MLKRFAQWVLARELATMRHQIAELGRELTERRRRQRALCPDCERHIWTSTGDHAGCALCDGSGWKSIMIGATATQLPCTGPFFSESR